ncbi:MAG: phosphatase PAP2 family protein [Saprospiraceae bacterium]|nr:phosphatase PAP2 family protein [Saprospiraceae bacterium]|tara:strand:- start:8646 stop:9671 length:1026 start_codon:yes stop_codon:yes gene_type:complete
MFQTEINHFFQSFASDTLTIFMQFITSLGYPLFFLVFISVLLFAVHFKKAFLLFLILMWTGSITYILKDYFSLPRPFHVDNSLILLDGQLPDEANFDLNRKGATGFWNRLSDDVLERVRQADHIEYGFPSGHSSIAIAFWGAFALIYRRKWAYGLSLALIILIPMSRLYLGVHFLADVLGGLVLGASILAIFYWQLLQSRKMSSYLQRHKYDLLLNFETAFLTIAPLILLFFLPIKAFSLVAFLMGFGISFIILAQKGLPLNDGSIIHRILRTVLCFLIFAIVSFSLNFLISTFGLVDNTFIQFIKNLLATYLMIWLGIELGIKLGWFQRPEIPFISTKKV